MARGKKNVVKKTSTYEERAAWHFGLSEIKPVKERGNISSGEEVERDVNWIAERAKDYIFSEFYSEVIGIAKKFGKNESERRVYLKKLMTLVSEESLAVATEVGLIENMERKKMRLSKGCAF